MQRSLLTLIRSSARDLLTGGVIFGLTLITFILSPLNQVTDSNYSMLLSQSLIEHHSFALDAYALPRLEPVEQFTGYTSNGEIYQLELANDHIYYYFPPGGSILSVPFVAVMNAFGLRAANADGTHNLQDEIRMQMILAALLMAALSVIFFYTSRLMLPVGWSAAVALGSALGTPVWSTASRALWSDTWSILLLGCVILILLAHETGRRRLNPVLLATLLAWMYFVRPTNAVSIAAITIYIFVFARRAFIAYALTGAVWLAGFVSYSWYNFNQLLPDYYQAQRLWFNAFWVALPSNFISPSRGLVVFSPIILFVVYLLVRYRSFIPHRRLMYVALGVIVVHAIIVSGFPAWWGGFCYGPRYMTGIVPWIVLLGALGVKAMLDASEQEARTRIKHRRIEMAFGAVLLMFSVLIHARGAISVETQTWNAQPFHIDHNPSRVWDFRRPQFLAGLVSPAPSSSLPVIAPPVARIDFTKTEAEPYLCYGWSGSETRFRWSDGHETALCFALPERADDLTLEIRLGAFIVPGRLAQQTVHVELNNTRIETLTLREEAARGVTITIPRRLLQLENVLKFILPDAASPAAMQTGDDPRTLGIRVERMEFRWPGEG